MPLEIYPIESEVQIGVIEGVVLSVRIMPGNVLYEIGFWSNDGKWTETWFNAFMVKSRIAKENIGFSRQGEV